MAISRQTLIHLRGLRVRVGAEADDVTRSMTRGWVGAWRALRGEWDRAVADLTAHTALTGRPPTVWELGRIKRLGDALQATEEALGKLAERAGLDITDAAGRVIHATADTEPRLISSQLPAGDAATIMARFGGIVTPSALDMIVARTQNQITSTLRPLSHEATTAMRRHLVSGIASGDNPVTAARRMLLDVEGAFNGGLTRAITVARTEMLDAYRATSREIHAANGDLLVGWIWISALDDRTCSACWSKHGSEHPLSEPGPLDHPQGRCARIPKTKSWRDLGIDIDEPASAVVDAQEKFWSLPAARQQAIMGSARLELLKSGRISWGDLAQRNTPPGWRPNYTPRPVGQLQTIARQRAATGEPLTLPPRPPSPSLPGPAGFDARLARARTEQGALDASPTSLGRITTQSTGLSEAEQETLAEYRNSHFYTINRQLRAGKVDPYWAERVEAIDDVMARSRLADDVVLYRGIGDGTTAFGDRFDGDLTGVTWTERGYVSTSASRRAALDFAHDAETPGDPTFPHPMLIRLVTPDGTGAVRLSDMKGEAELLLQRGLRLRVATDHGVVDGVRQLDVEVLPATKASRALAKLADDGADTKAAPIEVRPALRGRDAYKVTAKFEAEYERITGHPVKISLPPMEKLSAKTLAEHYEGLLRAAERFPDVDLDRVGWWSPNDATYAQAFSGAGRIEFGLKWMTPSGRDTYLRTLASDVASGWHPAGFESPASIAIHEFGHLLHIGLLRSSVNHEVWETLRKRAEVGDHLSWDGKISPARTASMEVSGYSGYGVSPSGGSVIDEMVAEAFADVMLNGAAARLLSREIFKILEDAYDAARTGPARTAVARAAPSKSTARIYADRMETLREISQELGQAKERRLSGGSMAQTSVFSRVGRTRVVRKIYVDAGAADRVDAEELAPMVQDALGMRTAAAVRTRQDTVLMEFVDGRGGFESEFVDTAGPGGGIHRRIFDSPDGYRLGLSDVITREGDRHTGNWLVDKDGRLVGIDHGQSFAETRLAGGQYFGSRFARRHDKGTGWLDHDLSPEDMAELRPRLEALKPLFVDRGRGSWWLNMMKAFDEVAAHAKGTKRLLT